jgi:hypothetical protein
MRRYGYRKRDRIPAELIHELDELLAMIYAAGVRAGQASGQRAIVYTPEAEALRRFGSPDLPVELPVQ